MFSPQQLLGGSLYIFIGFCSHRILQLLRTNSYTHLRRLLQSKRCGIMQETIVGFANHSKDDIKKQYLLFLTLQMFFTVANSQSIKVGRIISLFQTTKFFFLLFICILCVHIQLGTVVDGYRLLACHIENNEFYLANQERFV